ncbi:MAG: RNA recognition motif-containing protein [Saprospiraceae bacterium]|jgi:RNA recognition motif-containing protein
MKLLIRNLARATTESALHALFESHGKVLSCTLVLDKTTGLSKGFGFVTMSKPLEAKSAMQAINYRSVDGNRLRVKKAESKAEIEVKSTRIKPDPQSTTRKSSSGANVWEKPD